jgi:uncharacterized protein YdeI (BOF family)
MAKLRHLPLAAAVCLGATPTLAQSDQERIESATNLDWVTITGEVKSAVGESFVLDYGAGDITVEMDDFDWYNENVLLPGDDVTITGLVDNDFYERRTIEASSVYIDKLQAFRYASSADEEGGYYAHPLARYATDDEWIGISGTVVSREGEELTVNTGPQEIEVDTEDLARTPDVSEGDRVSIYGKMDDNELFDDRELEAYSVTVLSQG